MPGVAKKLFMLAAAALLPLAADHVNGSGSELNGAPAAELRVMSFNIRTLMLSDGRDYWAFRRGHVAQLIRKYDPDLAGMQEVFKSQANDLQRRLPDYAWFGPPREDGKRVGERCPIFFRKDRLELEAQGTFWLSETPDVPGSRSWDAAFPRLVTWGRFKQKSSGAVFYLFNTHFDHMGQTAREMSAKIILAKISEIAGSETFIVTGDFNSAPDTSQYQTLAARL
ncbi:MAG TPA: endonuclease/exonuclease/phosphatase family protein, partial [bacterium]|nr:endonuclease/exonuclease/phosphatase family protein [bacterium]